jgi:hypothetical protein
MAALFWAAAWISIGGEAAGQGLQVWNMNPVERCMVTNRPEAGATLQPVRVAAVRNGTFSAMVGVDAERPIRKLQVVASDLRGPGGVIAGSAVSVRYAVPDGATPYNRPTPIFDSLEDAPPAELPVIKERGGAFQPLWLRIHVPAEAAPGEYQGKLSISAEGVAVREVPVSLRVSKWTLPPTQAYTTLMDYIQSPESTALAYDVPMWSDAHLAQLDRTFQWLAELGCKTLYITAVRRTHFGNEQAMVRWTVNDEGDLTPDLSIVEKYLDVAGKRLGKIPGVVLCCWEPSESEGHADYNGSRVMDKKILITVVDPATRALSAQQGPAWGSADAREFWGKFNQAMAAVLKKRGLEQNWMFGLIGDARPTKEAMDAVMTGTTNAAWAVCSHFRCEKWQEHPIALASAVWGIGCNPVDPSQGYCFGWSNPWSLTLYGRNVVNQAEQPVVHRVLPEGWMGARTALSNRIQVGVGARGIGHIGADFWSVQKGARGGTGTLAGRYPESGWGQLNLNYTTHAILGRGRNGAVPTVRSEQYREAIQELEVRIYLDKVWLDPEAETILGADLLRRLRETLDERIRLYAPVAAGAAKQGNARKAIVDGMLDRSTRLFALAEEVAGKYGGREPKPNLKSRDAR